MQLPYLDYSMLSPLRPFSYSCLIKSNCIIHNAHTTKHAFTISEQQPRPFPARVVAHLVFTTNCDKCNKNLNLEVSEGVEMVGKLWISPNRVMSLTLALVTLVSLSDSPDSDLQYSLSVAATGARFNKGLALRMELSYHARCSPLQ